MVKKILCENKTLITSISKIVVSVSSILVAGGMIWLISTVNANERKVASQETRLLKLEKVSEDRTKILSNMNREIGELGSMIRFLAEKAGYEDE
jgi:hypothetical protein